MGCGEDGKGIQGLAMPLTGAVPTSMEMAMRCVQMGWLSPEAAAIAGTEPLEHWWSDVVRSRNLGALLSPPGWPL